MKDSRPKTPVVNVSDLFSEPQEAPVKKNEIVSLKEYEEEALEFLKTAGEYQGIPTGYPTIDERLGSFLPGELFTLGGDTGHGKSLLAMNIAQNVYKSQGQPVLLVNLELTRNQAVQRFYDLSGNDRDYEGIYTQTANEVNYKDIKPLMKKAKELGVCLVVIDHLHFFDDSIGDNAASALTRVVKYFKTCATKYDLPVLLLSHVTPTTKPDGTPNRPDLHGFKGSRSIEQLSDMVGFIYRDQKETKNLYFYLRKNRSRPLDPTDANLTQIGWRLHEGSYHEPPRS